LGIDPQPFSDPILKQKRINIMARALSKVTQKNAKTSAAQLAKAKKSAAAATKARKETKRRAALRKSKAKKGS